MQVHPLIETNAALAQFCDLIKDSDFIAVDTEFMRENTFWPELCLIQVANSDHAAAIIFARAAVSACRDTLSSSKFCRFQRAFSTRVRPLPEARV